MAEFPSALTLEAVGCAPPVLQRQASDATRSDGCLTDGALSTRTAVVRNFNTNVAQLDRSAESIRPSLHCEVLVQTDVGAPIKRERCLLQVGPETFQETTTDDQGIARFTYFVLDDNKEFIPKVLLPDILESEGDAVDTVPQFPTKDRPVISGLRRRDETAHVVIPTVPKNLVTVKGLTEEQKFQHFYRAYTDNAAVYANGNPGDYAGDGSEHWDFYRGAVCNQHVNFFLGYWFNYNHSFTRAGSTSVVCTLPMFTSAQHPFQKTPDVKAIAHRGYKEFVEPVAGYGVTNVKGAQTRKPPSPQVNNYIYAYEAADYIRLSEYFNTDGTRRGDGNTLVAALGDFNFYSVSNFYEAGKTTQKQNSALKSTRDWLQARLTDDATYKCKSFTHNGILYLERPPDKAAARTAPRYKLAGKLSDYDVWDIIWFLDPSQPEERTLLQKLRLQMNTDHHGGLLLKRGRGCTSPRGVAPEDLELWTFSADGTYANPEAIVLRPFSQTTRSAYMNFAHWAIWKLKPLRSGGYAPLTAAANEGKVGIDNPSRFIHWHK